MRRTADRTSTGTDRHRVTLPMVQEPIRHEVRHRAVREIIAEIEAIRRPHAEPWV